MNKRQANITIPGKRFTDAKCRALESNYAGLTARASYLEPDNQYHAFWAERDEKRPVTLLVLEGLRCFPVQEVGSLRGVDVVLE